MKTADHEAIIQHLRDPEKSPEERAELKQKAFVLLGASSDIERFREYARTPGASHV